jgi:hypothetical protein
MADNARDGFLAFFKRYVTPEPLSNELELKKISLRASEKYSDFVITCGGDTYRVHKAVVCGRSGFFERAERFAVGKV